MISLELLKKIVQTFILLKIENILERKPPWTSLTFVQFKLQDNSRTRYDIHKSYLVRICKIAAESEINVFE